MAATPTSPTPQPPLPRSVAPSYRTQEERKEIPTTTAEATLPLHNGDVESIHSPGHNSDMFRAERLQHRQQQQQELQDQQRHNLKRSRTLPPFIRPEGESGRNGFSPLHFLRICFRSSSAVSCAVNVLWPVVPAALVVRYSQPDWHLTIFALSYIAMVPCANLVGFAGQELARKVAHVYGVLVETTFGSIVEIILFIVLLVNGSLTPVIQAAILGSVLATMLLCLGLCFIAGGIRREETEHNEAISEAGSGLLLTAGVGLAIPAIFQKALKGSDLLTSQELSERTLSLSRATAILLILAYVVFVWFQAKTHHGIYDAIFEQDDQRDTDRRRDMSKEKLTLLECALALAVSLALVTIIAITLVEEIDFMVLERGISEAFMGLILVPLVEKAAEHLTAIDEAWDNQMNFALSHVLGATLQTALFNGPLVVIVGWILNKPMALDFHIFDIAVLLLAIITVDGFLRDGKTNYLEGSLCVIVYIAIAAAAYHYPNPAHLSGGSTGAH
uniref:Vacuolar calcium ion transporter n=1 Tax=Pyricularia oryzae (strain P131) TaxID=1143193 RepID=L7JJJ2_PYRO1